MTRPALADRAGRLSPRARACVAAAAGLVAAAGLAPLLIWPLLLMGLAVLALLVGTAGSPRAAAWAGWGWATGYFLHALSWIVEPFLVDIARHGWMAPFALTFMAGGLALFWAAAAWAAHRLGNCAMMRALALPLTLGLAELTRGIVLTGFPWAGLAQAWIDAPGAALLAWVGPNGLSVWIAAAACWPVAAWLGPRGVVRRLASALPLAGLAVAGLALAPPDAPAPGNAVVRVLQPNARQDQKWDPDHIPRFFERQLSFSEAAPAPDLIVWPEVAIPWFLEDADPAFEVMADRAGGVAMAVGLQRTDGLRYYNSLVRLSGAGAVTDLYDKHHLVPFGEYMPLGALLARFGIHGLAASQGGGYSAGPGPQLMDFGPLGRALPLICYEAVFPRDVLGAPERPDFLLHVTNDAWFGARSGPYQHLVQARMRAIETGLPLVRSANTGISAMIDPFGRVTAEIPLGTAGFVDAVLPDPLPSTLYARTGDLPVTLALLAGLGLLMLRRRRRRRALSD